jgi:predicted nucleic acid-binding protein
MNAVVDTNVIAYYLLGTEPFAAETHDFWQSVEQPIAPAHWQAELASVLWMAIRAGALPANEGHRRLDFASRLRVRGLPIGSLWQGALALSLNSGVSPYDTLFVALAQSHDLPLATFDKQVLKAFPGIGLRPKDIARK